MSRMRIQILCAVAACVLSAVPAHAQRQQSVQVNAARERARGPYQVGLEYLRTEKFDEAARAFQDAIDIDPTFDMAFYMLGRSHLMTRQYVQAVRVLTRCRELYQAEASAQSLTRQEIQQQRRQRIDELSDRISSLNQSLVTAPPGAAVQIQNEIRLLEESRRQIQDAERQASPGQGVPAFVLLSLGSAYFRSGRLKEAEEAYLETVAVDPKVGEAHSNLAVVYMETGRLDKAEEAVRAAERAGLRVNPALKDEIKRRRKAGS